MDNFRRKLGLYVVAFFCMLTSAFEIGVSMTPQTSVPSFSVSENDNTVEGGEEQEEEAEVPAVQLWQHQGGQRAHGARFSDCKGD